MIEAWFRASEKTSVSASQSASSTAWLAFQQEV